MSYISIFRYEGKNSSLREINSNYFRIVGHIDLSASLTPSTNTDEQGQHACTLTHTRAVSPRALGDSAEHLAATRLQLGGTRGDSVRATTLPLRTDPAVVHGNCPESPQTPELTRLGTWGAGTAGSA